MRTMSLNPRAYHVLMREKSLRNILFNNIRSFHGIFCNDNAAVFFYFMSLKVLHALTTDALQRRPAPPLMTLVGAGLMVLPQFGDNAETERLESAVA